MQPGVRQSTGGCVLSVGTCRVVALLADLPAHGVPNLVQVNQWRFENGLGIAPDLQLALANVDFAGGWARLADEVAVGREAMLAQGLHHLAALRRAHLQHDAQFLVEQSLERKLFAACTHLPCPVFAVTHVHAAVRNAITFGDQHVDVQRHPHTPGKGHFSHCGKQTTVAAVMVGQNLALGAQGVHGVDQIDQVLGIVQIGHSVAHLIQRLRQDAGGHAVLAMAQID